MDYPDPDEEYELMHADEFELMNELHDEDDFNFPSTKSAKPIPKRQLDFAECNSNGKLPTSSVQPLPPDNQNLSFEAAIQQVPEKTSFLPVETPEAATFDDNSGVNVNSNKRTVDSLFGDISDIDFELCSQTKRQKFEDDEKSKGLRHDLLIKTIVEQRQKAKEEKMGFGLSRQIKEKRTESLICSGALPKWPFMPINVKGERVYAKLNSEESVKKLGFNFESESRNAGFLEVPYSELYKQAMESVASKINKSGESNKENVSTFRPSKSKELWVEKYKPRMYLHLLSDESTNRALLYWLKMWDKVVFNQEPKVMKRGFPGQEKRDLLDEHHRPIQKVALLCGPPGLGKTTLAHMIAKQAGYCPVEVNASDDRTAQSFKTSLEAATQMKSVMGSNPLPNCLILDEIDGAPQPAIDVLVKYVTDKGDSKQKKKKGLGLLKRPIICICNDVYVPALRSLRQIAYTLVFPVTSSARLSERLMEISKMENIITDMGTMMVLSEKSNNDIRSCLSVLQCLRAKGSNVTLTQVQSSSMGAKDMQHSLFSVWESIFQIKLSRKGQGSTFSNNKSKMNNHMHLSEPSKEALRAVQSYGNYERLAIGVFENYGKLRTADSSLIPVTKALKCFVYFDLLSNYIQSSQNYALFGYLPWAFVQWHVLFASIQRPKLSYPSIHYDVNAKIQRNIQTLEFAFSGMAAKLKSYQQRDKLLLDVGPILVDLINPCVRPVSVQLYSQKEKDDLQRVVSVMADYNLSYTQMRNLEGNYKFHLDPNLEEIVRFGEQQLENTTSYTVRQLLSKEVEAEKIRRSVAKSAPLVGAAPTVEVSQPDVLPEASKFEAKPNVPNHLQKLTPKALKHKVKEVQAKDFFGRIVQTSSVQSKRQSNTDEIVKSDIWFHFKEGYNNAVRKNVYVSDLL